jgi:hypothetical protein
LLYSDPFLQGVAMKALSNQEWRERLERAVAETLRRRADRAAIRRELDDARQAGLRERHATKLRRTCAGDTKENGMNIDLEQYRRDQERWTMANRHVETWDTSRLVLDPGRARRRRERIVVKYCAEGFLANTGSPREKVCQSIFDWAAPDFREQYHAFHEDRHTTWTVSRYQGRSIYSQYYCDAHLPDELREITKEKSA